MASENKAEGFLNIAIKDSENPEIVHPLYNKGISLRSSNVLERTLLDAAKQHKEKGLDGTVEIMVKATVNLATDPASKPNVSIAVVPAEQSAE